MAYLVNVDDQYRKNELSLIPGGATVKIIKTGGKITVYDKVKSVRAYTSKAMKDPDVIEILVNDTTFWKRN